MEVERGAVVDEPGLVLPDKYVRVLSRAIHVRNQRVEPDNVRGKLRQDPPAVGDRVEPGRAGKIAEAEIQAAAPLQEVLDLSVRLSEPEAFGKLDDCWVGHRQAHYAREPGGNRLGNECLWPLSGAAELKDELTRLIGVDDSRQRAPLTEGEDIPGRGVVGEWHGIIAAID